MVLEIGEMVVKIIERTTVNRTATRSIEIEVKIMLDPGQDIGTIYRIIQIQEIDTEIIETKSETDKGLILVIGKIVEQGLDQAHM